MRKTPLAGCTKRSTLAVAAFVQGVKDAAAENVKANEGNTTLDSATSAVAGGVDFLAKGGVAVPDHIRITMDEFGDKALVKAILDSAHSYEEHNGVAMSPELMELAMHNAYGQTQHARNEFKLDSAFSTAHDPQSLQPNRAVLAVFTTVAETPAWVAPMPVDIKSNEGRLAIVSNTAVGRIGGYDDKELLDGVNAGKPFVSAVRVHKAFPNAEGKINFKITGVQDSEDTCLQTIGGAPTLRGRGEVYINGQLVGREAGSVGSSGACPVNGLFTIDGVNYQIGGSYNSDNGEGALTTTPALPESVPVYFETVLNFERDHSLSAVLGTNIEVFSIFASAWRGRTRMSPDARTQMGNEMGVDPMSSAMMALQRQYIVERHYRALAIARRAAVQNLGSYDFQWNARNNDMTRAKIWGDFGPELGARSQQMVEATLDHGIDTLYVGKDLKSQWEALPRELFEPSGVTERPGIYRFGRLFGKYDCWYDPKAKETHTSAQILAVGRPTNAARGVVVWGDAVSPTIKQLAAGDDQNEGMSMFARDFTKANPHPASAMGASLITVTNLR